MVSSLITHFLSKLSTLKSNSAVEMFDEMLQYPQGQLVLERRWKSNPEVAPNCPRCASPNTKFCYYNNYSLSQPRYFCKACRRYWTKGGSLRNVPVGGGCRKARRSKSSKSSSLSALNFNPSSSPSPADPSPEIDLAAVFANFVNTSSGSETNDNSSSSLEVNNNNMIECDHPRDLIDEARIHQVLPRIEDDVQVFMVATEMNELELQDMIADELPAPESLPDFGWQTQEFGSFLPDDQFKVSNNLIGENWGSFDTLGYELFSRP